MGQEVQGRVGSDGIKNAHEKQGLYHVHRLGCVWCITTTLYLLCISSVQAPRSHTLLFLILLQISKQKSSGYD